MGMVEPPWEKIRWMERRNQKANASRVGKEGGYAAPVINRGGCSASEDAGVKSCETEILQGGERRDLPRLQFHLHSRSANQSAGYLNSMSGLWLGFRSNH